VRAAAAVVAAEDKVAPVDAVAEDAACRKEQEVMSGCSRGGRGIQADVKMGWWTEDGDAME
jgi:hypothetical protein